MNKHYILDAIQDYWDYNHPTKTFEPEVTEIPVSGAWITSSDIVSVVDAVLGGWFTEWKKAFNFSANLAKYVGVQHAILCNSGSSADLLALAACKEKYFHPNRNKIVTCATGFPTTIAPIIQLGYMPLFVDIDTITLNPRENDVAECLDRDDVAGAMLAHTLGRTLQLVQISPTKFYIEDACDALGGKGVGRYGNLSTVSFFPAHQITTGEGGAVLTDDDELAELARSYRDWGRACYCWPGQANTCGKRFSHQYPLLPYGYDHKYVFERLGYNLKMTELQAALGVSQLKRIDEFTVIRQKNYEYLYNRLFLLYQNGYIRLYSLIEGSSPFGFPISVTTDSSFTKNEMIAFLERKKIRTRPVFAGNITRHPMMKSVQWEAHNNLLGSDYVMDRTFWVGCHQSLTLEMMDFMADMIIEFVRTKL